MYFFLKKMFVAITVRINLLTNGKKSSQSVTFAMKAKATDYLVRIPTANLCLISVSWDDPTTSHYKFSALLSTTRGG